MVKRLKYFSRKNGVLALVVLGLLGIVLYLIRWVGCARVVEPVETQEDNDYNNNNNRRILLLGDSILDNRMYVSSGKSVADLLQKATQAKGYQVGLFAVDGATIRDVGSQLNQIPMEYNTPETVIVLSVGGNDFLSGSEYGAAEQGYVSLVERIRKVFGECKIYLVNLYRPVDPLFLIYYRIIDKWNLFLERIVEKGFADGVVDVFSVISDPEDLVVKIEPSVVGGEKIVTAIVDQMEG
jgi:hypothetical protein